MSKHGTTSILWPGWFIEFQAKVIQALPRDIEADTALGWVNSGEALRKALRKALMPPDTYIVFVDRRLIFDEVVRRANFDIVEEEYRRDDLELRPSLSFGDQPPRAIPIRLMKLEPGTGVPKILERMTDLGLRPADLRELVSLVSGHPEILQVHRIVSLGSELPKARYPAVGLMGTRKILTSVDIKAGEWGNDWTFAAVDLL